MYLCALRSACGFTNRGLALRSPPSWLFSQSEPLALAMHLGALFLYITAPTFMSTRFVPIRVLRSLTPFAVCVGDFIWLGRAWPTTQSWFALVAMTLCTIFIFVREPSITAAGVFWGVVYYVLLSMVGHGLVSTYFVA